MKYCVKCGNELGDDALLCTNCGCMTHDSYQLFKKKQKASPKVKKQVYVDSKIVYVFKFLINIFLVTTITLFLFSIIYPYIRLRFYSDNYIGITYYLEYECCLLALIFSSISLVLSIVGISIHGKKTPTRRTELTFDFIIKIILSAALLSAAICGCCQ